MSDPRVFRKGRIRGDKIQYQDGIGCTVWMPLSDDPDSEDAGLCWDFSHDDIDDLIALLQEMKSAPARRLPELKRADESP